MRLIDRIIRWFAPGNTGSAMAVNLEPSTLKTESNRVTEWIDWVDPEFPAEVIPILNKLIMWTPDLSQAVKRMLALGNTGFDWTVEGADERTTAAILEEDIPEFFERFPGITNALMRQTIITGALSAEAVPAINLKELEAIQLIPTASIRHKKERLDSGRYVFVPYQELEAGGLLRLNPEQYTYEAIERSESSPYGIPPFLAALPYVYVQLEGREGLRGLLDRLRLLGFIHIAKDAPRRGPGQTDAEHESKVKGILRDIRDAFVKSRREGLVVSTSDVKATYSSFSSDSRGFEQPWRANEEQIASGLDMPPSLLGRSYSTTETYAGVDYTAFINKLGNMRHPTKRFIQKAVSLHLQLKGRKFGRVVASWKPDAALQPDRDATAEKTKEEAHDIRLRWLKGLLEMEIIDEDALAKAMGFEAARTGQKRLKATHGGRVVNMVDYQKKSPEEHVHAEPGQRTSHGS